MKYILKKFIEGLKAAGVFFASLTGLDNLGKSEEGQDLQDTFNDLVGRPVFQTEKVKREAEQRAKEEKRRTIQEIATTTKKTNESIEKLIENFTK